MSTTTNIASSHELPKSDLVIDISDLFLKPLCLIPESHWLYSWVTLSHSQAFWPYSKSTLSSFQIHSGLIPNSLRFHSKSTLSSFQIYFGLIPNLLWLDSKSTLASFQSHSVLIPWLFYELSAEYRDPIPEGGEKSKVDANVPPTSPESITGILDNVLFFCRKCLTLLSLPLYTGRQSWYLCDTVWCQAGGEMSHLLPRSPPNSKRSALYVAHQSFILMLPDQKLGGELSRKTNCIKGDYGYMVILFMN